MTSDDPRLPKSTAATPRARMTALVAALAAWGPGLLVMLADADAGNVITAAQSGVRWSYRLLPLLLLLIPLLYMIQELAVRLGLFTGKGFAELIREHFGRGWAYVALAAVGVATLGSLVTELIGIAGVGELYGVSRMLVLPVAAACLLLVVLSGKYRRVERAAIVIGLFELSFFLVAWSSHPHLATVLHDAGDQRFGNTDYLYLCAALIGATFNPWMVFYQTSALAEKKLGGLHHRAARADTAVGAVLTQAVTAAVLVAAAATIGRTGATTSLDTVGQISGALTPLLGGTIGRLVFGMGVVGAAMVAAIVCSLAFAWSVGEVVGLSHTLERQPLRGPWFYVSYTACVGGSAVIVLRESNLVWLSIAAQVVNALLLPLVAALLLVLAATVLPAPVRLRGPYLWVVATLAGLVSIAGLVGAVAGLA
ncbi:NRAMP family divalent metal transporter [Lichenicoccus sp.]|uniref:NRAMP family divalent metal transporter n=1 Tax=Lichenicoccus sp. TaxID=2781899 RepID=UPI003D150213